MNKKSFLLGIIVAAVAICGCSSTKKATINEASAVPAESPVVGVWEKEGVRKAFEFREGRWLSSLDDVHGVGELKTASTKYAQPREWLVYFDGQTFGKIETKPFGEYKFYYQNGLQKVVTGPRGFKFRKPDKKFYGWDGERMRPVAVTSLPAVKDPNSWKPTKIDKVNRSILDDLNLRLKGIIAFCKDQSCEGERFVRPLQLNEVKTSSAYRAKDGKLLIAVALNVDPKTALVCQSGQDSCSIEGSQWYLKSSGGDVKFLTSAAALIDSGDFNSDGYSDLLFWIAEYNLDGYELVDGKSGSVTRSAWGYH